MINDKAVKAYEWAKSVQMEIEFCFGGRWYKVHGAPQDVGGWMVYEHQDPDGTKPPIESNTRFFKDFDDIERNCKIQGKDFIYAISHCESIYC